MPQKKSLQITDLSGGMDTKTQPLLLPDNKSALIINGDLGRVFGSISARGGYELQGAAMTPESDVLGMGNLAKPDGTHKIIGVCGSDCYLYNTINETWTAQNQGLTAAAKAEFATYLNKLFMVNYSNDTRAFDGENWSTSTDLDGAPRAKYLQVYKNRLYLANCVIQPNPYPSRVYYSSLPTDGSITWDTTENTGDYFEVDTDDNDMIRGLGTNSNRLLIFKEYSLHTWDGTSRMRVLGAPGTNSQRSVVNINEWTYYFNRRGVHRFNGRVVEYISEPVQPYIAGVSPASSYKVCGGSKNLHYLLYIGEVKNTEEDIEERRVLLDLDTVNSTWTVNILQTRPQVFLSCPTGAF